MIVLLAKYHVIPGKREQVESILNKMAKIVREREPECHLYQVSHSIQESDCLLLYEHYADMAAVEAHRRTSHFRKLIDGEVAPLLERRERELFELVVP